MNLALAVLALLVGVVWIIALMWPPPENPTP